MLRQASERDAKIFVIEKNSSTILDGFKGNKTGWNEGDQLVQQEIEN